MSKNLNPEMLIFSKLILADFFRSDKKEFALFISEQDFIKAISELEGLTISGNRIKSPVFEYEYSVETIGVDKKTRISIKMTGGKYNWLNFKEKY